MKASFKTLIHYSMVGILYTKQKLCKSFLRNGSTIEAFSLFILYPKNVTRNIQERRMVNIELKCPLRKLLSVDGI